MAASRESLHDLYEQFWGEDSGFDDTMRMFSQLPSGTETASEERERFEMFITSLDDYINGGGFDYFDFYDGELETAIDWEAFRDWYDSIAG